MRFNLFQVHNYQLQQHQAAALRVGVQRVNSAWRKWEKSVLFFKNQKKNLTLICQFPLIWILVKSPQRLNINRNVVIFLKICKSKQKVFWNLSKPNCHVPLIHWFSILCFIVEVLTLVSKLYVITLKKQCKQVVAWQLGSTVLLRCTLFFTCK